MILFVPVLSGDERQHGKAAAEGEQADGEKRGKYSQHFFASATQ